MMKKTFCICLLALVTMSVHAQKQGIGLRLGEPMGFTYKMYLPNNKALEFGLGSSPRGWNSTYYTNSFEDRYDDYDHISHRVRNTVYLQARYLIHNNLNTQGIEGKLDWYWGIGAVLKTARVEYRYRDEVPPQNVYKDSRTDIDFGPEVIGGLEYTFEDIPLTGFGELSLLVEVADRRTIRLLGGLGIRYNF
jgi:hypothetical protein